MVQTARVEREPNRWRDEVERTMPARSDFIARNRAITARYARWYLTEPMFKWAGMAAWTSSWAGEIFGLLRDEGRPSLVGAVRRRSAQALLGETIELLRSTNFGVFDDVGWAHHAFLATDGDAQAIARELEGVHEHRDLVVAFTKIAEARELARDDERAERARALMWEGNLLILRHEQLVTVQPRFAQLDHLFRSYLTLLGATPFERLASAPVRKSWFIAYALRRMATTKELSVPDLTKFEQRWPWIESEVFTIFRETESRGDARLRAFMQRMAAGGG